MPGGRGALSWLGRWARRAHGSIVGRQALPSAGDEVTARPYLSLYSEGDYRICTGKRIPGSVPIPPARHQKQHCLRAPFVKPLDPLWTKQFRRVLSAAPEPSTCGFAMPSRPATVETRRRSLDDVQLSRAMLEPPDQGSEAEYGRGITCPG